MIISDSNGFGGFTRTEVDGAKGGVIVHISDSELAVVIVTGTLEFSGGHDHAGRSCSRYNLSWRRRRRSRGGS